MTKNALALVNSVLSRIGQNPISSFTTPQTPAKQALQYLNETRQEMVEKIPAPQFIKEGNLSLLSNINSYPLPSDTSNNLILQNTLMLFSNDEKPIRQSVKFVTFNYLSTSDLTLKGQPTHCYLLADKLQVWPTPNKSYSLSFYYRRQLTVMSTENDSSELPEAWEQYLVLGTQSRVEKFLGEDYKDTYLLYLEGIIRLKKQIGLQTGYTMKGY